MTRPSTAYPFIASRDGLLADRPEVASDGALYFAEDDLGGTTYRYDATEGVWEIVAPRGVQLLLLERTTDLTSISNTTPVNISGMEGVVTSRGRPLSLSWSYRGNHTVADNGLNVTAWADVGDTGSFVEVGRAMGYAPGAGFQFTSVGQRYRAAQAAGTVIRYKLMVNALIAGGSGKIWGDPPLQFSVIEV